MKTTSVCDVRRRDRVFAAVQTRVAVLGMASALAGGARAQTSRGAVSGTVTDGSGSANRNNDAALAGRPDIGSAAAPLISRAVVEQRCAARFQNPDAGASVTPSQVRWLQTPVGLFANASTVGRNTLEPGGTNNFDLSVFKSFPIGERRRLEFRWDAVNAFNHPQFIEVPERDLLGAPSGRFLNRDFTNSGIRSMWVQVKLVF